MKFLVLLQFFLATVLIGTDLRKISVSVPTFYNPNFMKALLDNYGDFQIIFHVDNASQYYSVLNRIISSIQIIIFNHDTTDEDLIRPVGRKCVNMVNLEVPLRFIKYLECGKNIVGKDVIIFWTEAGNIDTFSKEFGLTPFLQRAGNLLLFNKHPGFLDVYTVCFYCGNSSGELSFLKRVADSDDVADVEVLKENLYPRSFNDFKGHLLKVTYVNYFPFIYCLRTSHLIHELGKVCAEAVGSDYELLKSVSARLNFTFQLVQAPNNSYQGLFEMLDEGAVDFAIGGLSITVDRLRRFHFTNVFRIERIVFMMRYQRLGWSVMLAFFLPFKKYLWGALGLVVFVFTSLTTVILRFYSRRRSIKYLPLRVFEKFIMAALEQSVDANTIPHRRKTAMLLILALWWIFSILMGAIYKSKLASFLIHPPRQRFTNIGEVLDQGYHLVLDDAFVLNDDFFANQNQAIMEANKKAIRLQGTCEVLGHVLAHKSITINEVTMLTYNAAMRCKPSGMQASSLRVPRGLKFSPIGKTAQGWPFKVGAPFRESLTEHISLVSNGGFLEVWKKKTLKSQNLSLMTLTRWHKHGSQIDFRSYISQFVLYTMCISICAACFLCEILYFHCFRRHDTSSFHH